ncbi:metallophosphoesterase [Rhodopseudomonas palustris]|uniref:Metallophosphoesterase n=1 Tax=Rhodopseudomonas palustris TaxID=1076 RepID=A0A323UKV3_RHOPL|nr:metallophosphoesterase [Rhodopseudomonas palustris]PZA12837.1 metallophosphoesterase [Rhodopseudomonas palustris]
MRIAVISDLHLDFAPLLATSIDADVLVVAGDVALLTRGLPWVAEVYGHQVGRIIYVPGNHEFYRGGPKSGEANTHYEEQMSRGRELATSLGIDLLQNDVIEIDGVRFVGGTMWSDWSLLPDGWSRRMAMMMSQKGWVDRSYVSERQFHNDFREILYGGRTSRDRLTPSQMIALHAEAFSFFQRTLAEPFAGETVCITHTAPATSVRERGAHSWLYGSTDIESLMHGPTAPALWVHGHVHESWDYAIGETRVICNPRGYLGENLAFDPTLTVDVRVGLLPRIR